MCMYICVCVCFLFVYIFFFFLHHSKKISPVDASKPRPLWGHFICNYVCCTWHLISLCLISCIRQNWCSWPEPLNLASYGRTGGTEINATALQATEIMRLFHWLQFNWEAAMGQGREEWLLKSLRAVRFPHRTPPSLIRGLLSFLHYFSLRVLLPRSLAPSVPLSLGHLCLHVAPLSFSLSYKRYMDTME